MSLLFGFRYARPHVSDGPLTLPAAWLCPTLLLPSPKWATRKQIIEPNKTNVRYRSTRGFVKSTHQRHAVESQDAELLGRRSRDIKKTRKLVRQHFDRQRSRQSSAANNANARIGYDSEASGPLHTSLDSAVRNYILAEAPLPAIELLESRGRSLEIDGSVVAELAQSLHYCIRTRKILQEQGVELAHRLVNLYRAKSVPGHPKTTLHLLCCFRDLYDSSNLVSLWTWARSQREDPSRSRASLPSRERIRSGEHDTSYTGLQTYGVAIDALSQAGLKLGDCEEIFQEALRRFPANFNEYHLQPGASLEDPTRPTTHAGTSLTLLSGIAEARFNNDDSRQAYQALDTALKLHPSQLTKGFIASVRRHRPFFEQLSVICIYLRGGNRIPPVMLVETIKLGSRLVETLPNLLARFNLYSLLLRLMIASSSNGFKFNDTELLNVLKTGLDLIFSAGSSSAELGEATNVARSHILQLISALGMRHTDATDQVLLDHYWTSGGTQGLLVSLKPFLFASASGSKRFNPIVYMEKCFDSIGLESLITQWRSDVEAEGRSKSSFDAPLGDPWPSRRDSLLRGLITWIIRSELDVDVTELKSTTKEALRNELQSMGLKNKSVEKTVSQFERSLQRIESLQQRRKAATPTNAAYSTESLDSQYTAGLQQLLGTLHEAGSGDEVAIDLPTSPCTLLFSGPRIPDEWQQQLYRKHVLLQDPIKDKAAHESAVDPVEPTDDQSGDVQIHLSPTGMPIEQLRYQNWCAMNHLLLEADAFEAICERRIKDAEEPDAIRSRLHHTGDNTDRKINRERVTAQYDAFDEAFELIREISRNKETWQGKIVELRSAGLFDSSL